MKKLTIAIASISALAASATFAQTVYEGDDLTLEIKGEVDSQLRKKTVEDSHLEHRFDDVDLAVKASHESDSGLTAFSYFKVDFKGEPNLSQAYIGIETSGATITFGSNDYATDAFGIGQDVEFGTTTADMSTGGNEVIRIDYEMDGLFLSASYDLPETETSTVNLDDEDLDDEYSVDLYAEFTAADGITVAGFYQNQKESDSVILVDGADDILVEPDAYNAFGASIEYTMDALTAGAAVAYTDSEIFRSDFGNLVVDGYTSIELSGAYKVSEALKVAGGFGMLFLDSDIVDDPMQFYGNVQYTVAPMSTIYAELQYDVVDDADSNDAFVVPDSELGYAVGMKVKF